MRKNYLNNFWETNKVDEQKLPTTCLLNKLALLNDFQAANLILTL